MVGGLIATVVGRLACLAPAKVEVQTVTPLAKTLHPVRLRPHGLVRPATVEPERLIKPWRPR